MLERILHICRRCGYQWHSRKEHPGVCPHCKTPIWEYHENGRTEHDAATCPQCKKEAGK
jgi:predicted  nucleic acid-binding Zn-ribbon protein